MHSRRFGSTRVVAELVALLALFASAFEATAGEASAPPRFQVPPGFVVEKVAGPPLVQYPLFADFDERGRLYVAEGTGTNLPGEELAKRKLGRILRLEDADGDGTFDTSKVFADKLVFPQGVLWHNGALFVASHPSLWRFEDTDDDGRADRQEAVVSGFNFNGNGCDLHGPFLGPDGWLYWTDGRHGYEVQTREGKKLQGLASRIWRCRTDGTDIERLCGGGFDNPVELAFTPEGDIIGTMDQGPGDALLHYVEGGVYPMEHACLSEFAMTGPLLGAINQYSASLPVALCGLMHYRGMQFGNEYQGTLFTAQFNVHRIEHHVLVRTGGTFAATNKDFLTSANYDVHLSDVLEDADGSLLFIDMGAWFNYGCPTSKIAKPQVQGAIYRVRRADAPRVDDPWGKSLTLDRRSVAELVALLDDPRPKVRDQVVTELAKRDKPAIAALAEALRLDASKPRSVEARRNAVWALCRMNVAEAHAPLRQALLDANLGVRQAAVHAAGVQSDEQAGPALARIVIDDEPQLRLKAAESLGRIGRPEFVPALLEGLRHGATDRHLEHALIYALIRINDRSTTADGLSDPSPRVRQAALVALDQMPDGRLTQEQVLPLLDTDDPDLQRAALGCISRRPGWSEQTAGRLRQWLSMTEISTAQEQSLSGALLAFSRDPSVQELVSETLSNPRTTRPMHLLLLRVIARCRLDALPDSWRTALGEALRHDDLAVRREAIFTLKAHGLGQFDEILAEMSRQGSLPAELRIAALDCRAGRIRQLDADAFALLTGHLGEGTEPLLRVAAARTLASASLDRSQLRELASHVDSAGPIVLPVLVPAFANASDAESGRALIRALSRSPGTDALGPDDLEKLLKNYPVDVQALVQPLRDRLLARDNDQAAYLTQLMRELLQTPGNSERGREAFFSKKVGCYGCHTAAGKGGNIGPDLSQVGRFRTPRDLLEAIVFPSSAIVPHFRSYLVTTVDGRVVNGMIVRDTSEAIYLRTAGQLAEVRIAAKDIDDMSPSNVSLMPQGLEKTMTRQELSDLLDFLYQQR